MRAPGSLSVWPGHRAGDDVQSPRTGPATMRPAARGDRARHAGDRAGRGADRRQGAGDGHHHARGARRDGVPGRRGPQRLPRVLPARRADAAMVERSPVRHQRPHAHAHGRASGRALAAGPPARDRHARSGRKAARRVRPLRRGSQPEPRGGLRARRSRPRRAVRAGGVAVGRRFHRAPRRAAVRRRHGRRAARPPARRRRSHARRGGDDRPPRAPPDARPRGLAPQPAAWPSCSVGGSRLRSGPSSVSPMPSSAAIVRSRLAPG